MEKKCNVCQQKGINYIFGPDKSDYLHFFAISTHNALHSAHAALFLLSWAVMFVVESNMLR